MANFLVTRRIKTTVGEFFPGQVVDLDETGREAAILVDRRMITPVAADYRGVDPAEIKPVDPDALVGDEPDDLKELMGLDKVELQAIADNAGLDTSTASSKRELALLILAAAREADEREADPEDKGGADGGTPESHPDADGAGGVGDKGGVEPPEATPDDSSAPEPETKSTKSSKAKG